MIKEHISLPEHLVVDEGTGTCFMDLNGNYCHPFLHNTSPTLLFACSCLKISPSLPNSYSLEEMNWIITFLYIESNLVIIFLTVQKHKSHMREMFGLPLTSSSINFLYCLDAMESSVTIFIYLTCV